MTPEQLLRKRYLVIADYPNSALSVGTIIEQVEVGENEYLFNMEFFEPYPHLFRPLEWWEFRDEKDMPEYVKCITDCRIPLNTVLKANWETYTTSKEIAHRGNKPDFWIDAKYFLPATLSEYNEYIKQKQQ